MNILSTRKATDQEEKLATKLGFGLISYPLLRYEYQEPEESELEKILVLAPDAWVFTSKNGVEGFMRIFEQGFIPLKPKKIFAVGKKTASKLQELGFEAEIPEVETGTALAHFIGADSSVDSVVHFCGNLRRDELSVVLNRHDIPVTELIVYKTIKTNPIVEPPMDIQAILFYSPSAVDAFGNLFSRYNEIPLVAIGSTTAQALYKKNSGEVIVAEEASTESMLKTLKSIAAKRHKTRE